MKNREWSGAVIWRTLRAPVAHSSTSLSSGRRTQAQILLVQTLSGQTKRRAGKPLSSKRTQPQFAPTPVNTTPAWCGDKPPETEEEGSHCSPHNLTRRTKSKRIVTSVRFQSLEQGPACAHRSFLGRQSHRVMPATSELHGKISTQEGKLANVTRVFKKRSPEQMPQINRYLDTWSTGLIAAPGQIIRN